MNFVIIGKLKNLETRILNLEKICEKLEKNSLNNRKILSEKTQKQQDMRKSWNDVVDEWLNGEIKN